MPILNKADGRPGTAPETPDMKMGIPEHEIGKKEIEAKRKTVLIQDFKLRKDSNDPERRNSTTPILD